MFALEKDVVMGTFTHNDEYYPTLMDSVKKYCPNILFILQYTNLPINQNFEELRRKFKETGKRYWLFLDHDIRFMAPDTIQIALKTMIRGHYACVGVYSTYYVDYVPKQEELVERETGWIPGYFQLVDSHKVGHIGADLELPCPNTAIDTSYCVSIRKEGYKIGLAPTYMHHQYKPLNLILLQKIEMVNKYLFAKWGQFYFDTCKYCGILVGPDPGLEVWNLPIEKVYEELEKLYQAGIKDETNSMWYHMPMLREMAEGKRVTEFGVEKGLSTIAFASGKPLSLTGLEIVDVMDSKIKALLGRAVSWNYSLRNCLLVDIEETDLLFIDTTHKYEELKIELERHCSRVKEKIILHDTLSYGICGEQQYTKGLLNALNEFLIDHPEWHIERTIVECYGLTILERV